MTEVEFLIMANHVEAINSTLFMLGGGWTDLWRPTPPSVSHFGIGLGVNISWEDTNVTHKVRLQMESEDGKQVFLVEGQIIVGRPPTIPVGSDQRAVMAFNLDFLWPAAGGYRLTAQLNEREEGKRLVVFRVHDSAGERQA